MRETIEAWNRQSQIFENRLKKGEKQNNEPIQFISHFLIRNETGYQIEIFCDKQLKYKLKHLEQVDHEMQM